MISKAAVLQNTAAFLWAKTRVISCTNCDHTAKSAAPLILFVNNSLKKYLHKEKGMRSKRVKA